MSVAFRPQVIFDNLFARELKGLYEPWQAAPVPSAELLALNEELAEELGLGADALRSPEGVALLTGSGLPDGATPVAQAYSGHQFGGFSPRLGDGRALLLGEIIDVHGHRRDLHLKGSGRTPFSRGGDGKAAVGPMLRELLIGEAIHALGIPTTRALAVVATGEPVIRETVLPGAVLARVAASHIRVGTFEFAAAHGDQELVRRLADHAIARHHPHAAEAENPYLALFDAVVGAQASLVAQWMLVGFVHGVMNTDNMTISGESIDYGPCAFMDAFDPATVFSSIDHGGRYAYGNQPQVAQWNLARLAETLLGRFAADTEAAVAAATAVLETFPRRFADVWGRGMREKLGLPSDDPDADALINDLLAMMHAQEVDYTSGLRALSSAVRGEDARPRSLFSGPGAYDGWARRWRERVAAGGRDPQAIAAAMDSVNPVYIARNHHTEDALTSATVGDLEPLERLLEVVRHPFDERSGLEGYLGPAPEDHGLYRTFCGT